ncbi:hypothetical protein KSF_111600 [Reticulibacter mediterranei]|uniref:Peptidase inhibitor family I36 n=1 Tax=Reticulibacter mediterranei TaxID=2778369 RepID=A0A8J3J2G1_9CHLR|nr:hypothetical protein [Reticulibacter mediterranei]GHP01113.1 hypothetical protein KSF_111600 [Reticulibacter mediterranei]
MKQSIASFKLLLKQRYRFALVALLLAVSLVFAGGVSAPTAHAAPAGTIHGCPSGYVCIYPQNAGWNGDKPSLKYYYYGVYQLSNQYGTHEIFNNQYSNAGFDLCTDWNGTVCDLGFSINSYGAVDLTPINSVRVKPTY